MYTINAVVVGVDRSPHGFDEIQALHVACTHGEQLYLLGGLVTSGFSSQDKIDWLQWAEDNLLREEANTLWVDPFSDCRIIEIAASQVDLDEGEALQYNRPFADWLFTSKGVVGNLKNASFVRINHTNWNPGGIDLVSVKYIPEYSKWLLGENK